jgi:hypothetical protein
VRTNPQDSNRSHLEVMGHPKPASKLTFNDLPFLGLNLQYFLSKPIKIKGVQNNLLYPRFSEKTNKNWEKKNSVLTLWGVLGTFLGGLGVVEGSLEIPLSCPKIEGEYGELGPE